MAKANPNVGGAEVHLLDGRPINWHKPPAAHAKVRWSKNGLYGQEVVGSFRTIAALNRLNNLAVGKRGWKSGVQVIQSAYNTTVKASAGTHDFDACMDLTISGVPWMTQQAFFRGNGFACWYRYPPTFSMHHIHGLFLPPQAPGADRTGDFKHHGFEVGEFVDGGVSHYGRTIASAQIADYYAHKDGLASHAHDGSWFPANIKATIFDLDAYVRTRVGTEAK